MTEVVLEEVDTYILCLHNTIAQYIVTCPILDICIVEEWNPRAWVAQRYWGQGCLDLYMEVVRSYIRSTEACIEYVAETDA